MDAIREELFREIHSGQRKSTGYGGLIKRRSLNWGRRFCYSITAFIRLTPALDDSSFLILKVPITPVCST
mgnify:CR=1 FL=1